MLFKPAILAGALAFATNTAALNILLTNDDSWVSANVRATYDALVRDGHNVLLVGPAVQQSRKGGTFVLPETNITEPGGEFGSIPVGAPYFGQDVTNANLWYFNGTPAATAAFALDIIVPIHFGKPAKESVDLVVSGPNEGNNNGPFLYTLSGTIGAAYLSIERGFPAIALSAGNNTHRSFTTNTGAKNDPANLVGQLTANLVAAVARGVDTGKRQLLPAGVGLNVNFPEFGPTSNCTTPPFILTRLTGGAIVDQVSIDPTDGLPKSSDLVAKGVNTCLNGICKLPGEAIVSEGCQTAVSVFSIDYDAPTVVAAPIQAHLGPILGRTRLPRPFL